MPTVVFKQYYLSPKEIKRLTNSRDGPEQRYSLIGKPPFGKLTVVSFYKKNKHGQNTWLCKCECGGTIILSSSTLNSGHTKSCGCIRSKKT